MNGTNGSCDSMRMGLDQWILLRNKWSCKDLKLTLSQPMMPHNGQRTNRPWLRKWTYIMNNSESDGIKVRCTHNWGCSTLGIGKMSMWLMCMISLGFL